MNTNNANAVNNQVVPLPEFYVDDEKTRNRIELFLKNKKVLLSEELNNRNLAPKGDTQSVWYSKEYLKTVLNEIEMYNGDGLRIYFGEYEIPDTRNIHVHPGQICLLFVPTRKVPDTEKHIDIILENEDGFGQRYNAREELRNSGQSDFIMGFNIAAPYPPIGLAENEFLYPI